MTLTLHLPDEFSAYLPSREEDLAAVIAAGLRHWQGSKALVIDAWSDVAEILAQLPSPEEVLKMRPSPELAGRTSSLLEKNQKEGLTEAEQSEWNETMRIEHLVRMAKAKALTKMKAEGRAA